MSISEGSREDFKFVKAFYELCIQGIIKEGASLTIRTGPNGSYWLEIKESQAVPTPAPTKLIDSPGYFGEDIKAWTEEIERVWDQHMYVALISNQRIPRLYMAPHLDQIRKSLYEIESLGARYTTMAENSHER